MPLLRHFYRQSHHNYLAENTYRWAGTSERNFAIFVSDMDNSQSCALRRPGVPSMFDSLEVKVLYPT